MPPPPQDRLPPISPQLAVRVAVLGGFAFFAFAVIFFRLWFLQVLTGDDYVSQARENRERRVKIEAPRGNIIDRDGKVLVRTRAAPVVQILPNSIPDAEQKVADQYRKDLAAVEQRRLDAADRLRALERRLVRRRNVDGRRATSAERRERRKLARAAASADPVTIAPIPPAEPELRERYEQLGAVIGMPPRAIHRRVVRGLADQPSANVTIRTDVPATQFNYLLENRDRFPGIVVERRYLRSYPYDTLGAQLFGTLREISAEEIGTDRYRGVASGTRIGKGGLEEAYDRYLRGTDGYTLVTVNSDGTREETRRISRVDPIQGRQLRLTLDLGLQRAAQRAVKRGIDQAQSSGNDAVAGGFVALDPRNGEVLALGSFPSFDANLFAKPIDQATFDRLNSNKDGAPLVNRAISAGYPVASTFKPITAFAAVDEGLIDPSTVVQDTGVFEYGDREFKNANDEVYGSITMARAIQVSSDVYFYKLGAGLNERGPVLQEWARKLSFGRPTGIDLPGELGGLVPDAEWRNKGYDKYVRCTKRERVPTGTSAALSACGGIEKRWSGGDNVNLSIGQGDLQATPLQLAVAYATIANGGRAVTPHLGQQVEDGFGRQLEEIRRPAQRKVDLDPATLAAIREGMRGSTTGEGGTSADVFSGFPYPVYGKTGTAERGLQPDQSWFAAFVDDPAKPIVVVVTIERGGWGAETAAPAARLILERWFGVRDGEFRAGKSATR